MGGRPGAPAGGSAGTGAPAPDAARKGRDVSERPRASVEAGPEQLRYAGVLEKGMLLGLLILLLTYFLYVTGIMGPYVPLETLPVYWGDQVGRYLHEVDIPTGWSWLGMLRYGDFLNFVGIATLAGVTIFCYAAIVPMLWRRRDRTYAILAVLQILVLCVAASGLLGSGGH